MAIQAIYLTQRDQPERDQVEIVESFQPLVVREGVTGDERLSLGELHFLHFEPDPAKALFREFADGDDWTARLAWQRIMQIDFAAYDNPDQVRNDLPVFVRRFGASSPHDIFGLAQQVGNFVRLYRESGEPAQAVDLIETEVRRIGFDAPYFSHIIPLRAVDLFKETGRKADLRTLIEFSIAGLEVALERRERMGPTVAEEVGPPMPASLARWFWLWQGVDGSRSVFEVRNRQYRSYIDQLKSGLAEL